MPKKEKSTFSHFFKEDAETVQDIIHGKSDPQNLNETGYVKKEEFPRLTKAGEVAEDEFKAHWRKLRSFFRNGNNLLGLPSGFSPAIMGSLQTKTMVGTDFPVWIAGENYKGERAFCLSLKEVITQALDEIGLEEKEARILKENIERILHIANNHLTNKKPQLFQLAIFKILDELEKQIDISGEEAIAFSNGLNNLKQVLPENGVLLPYSIDTSFQILEAAMFATISPIRKKLNQEVVELKGKLKDLLRIEQGKGPERKNPDQLQDSLAFVDNMVKFDELSSMLPEAGSESMGKARVQRILNALEALEEAGAIMDHHGFLFVDEILHNNKNIDWDNLFENTEIEAFQKGKGCSSVGLAFDKHIATCTNFFVAKRIGELELENSYQPELHDEYFKHFTWQSFTSEELNSCPHFILIVDDIQIFDTEFSKLSTMLSDNIPVKIVAVKRDNYVDQRQNGSEKNTTGLHTQAELGALMLSHKNIFVAQSSSITPKYLFNGFKEGLSAFAPAFFYVLNIDEKIHKNPFLWTSATIESRDFPGFTFKGLLGTPWGSRFEVENNPQPRLNWPVHKITVVNAEGENIEMEFPFTFADQAVLNPAYAKHYMAINSSYWSDDLIPLTEYMERNAEDNIGKIPFIWMMDEASELYKVAVSWSVVLATQERLDFWRFLQENSGINNYHVTQAVEQAKAEMQEEHEKEIEQIKGVHEFEIQNVKEEEAGKAMENLVSVLLNLDTTNVVTSTNLPASNPPSTTSTVVDTEAEDTSPKEDVPQEIEEDEGVLSNDPYIDTALCTSCNECTDLNGAMFKYNADKMAYIADPNAGTFRELVEAAEVCPVGIIHPGSPLNPNEPDLDELIKRAEKFN